MLNKKHIKMIDLVLVVGTLILLSFFVNYARPLVIAPIDGLVTENASVLFEFDKADLILIDDNPDFSSPQEIYAEDNLIINLKPGLYYWKLKGALDSEVRQLTIKSEVNLKLRESGDGNFEIINAGNTKLSVDVYNGGIFTGKTILNVDESEEVSGTKFIGVLNE